MNGSLFPIEGDGVREFLRRVPKAELHVHLDGSLRLPSLIEMARADGVALPSSSPEGLRERVFKPAYANLSEYLAGFQYTVAVLRNPEHLERTAYELGIDNIEEGVRYLEVRFAPHLHVQGGLSIRDTIRAVDRGLQRAQRAHQESAAVRGGHDLPFEFGIIVCAMRAFDVGTAPYYRQAIESAGAAARLRDVGEAASFDLAQEAVRLRDEEGLPVTGFDLAGEEAGHPALHHRRAYQHAHNHFLRTTVHAGEDYGPESIFQAVSDCHAKRIGHGTHLFAHDMVRDPAVRDPVRYTAQLADYLASERITVEVCLTSNLQTLPRMKRIEDHPVKRMLACDIPVAICTDNRLVSNTSVTRELERAVTHLGLTRLQVRDLILAGFRGAFFPKPFRAKRAFVDAARLACLRLERELIGGADPDTTWTKQP